jgi:TRAP-type mannitol/chloroaromatic compound transport system substrate-binding protein
LAKPAIAQQRLEWKMVTSWPKGLAGVATGAERLAQRIGDLSGGQLTVKVYAAGELVPALQVPEISLRPRPQRDWFWKQPQQSQPVPC